MFVEPERKTLVTIIVIQVSLRDIAKRQWRSRKRYSAISPAGGQRLGHWNRQHRLVDNYWRYRCYSKDE
jgi:hypothetical protein